MKKLSRILLVILLAAAACGVIYWQLIKKKIVRNSIEKAIVKKSDSLYYLHYDSSRIDEVNGNARFYNVVLQSDSAQKALLNSTDSLPNVLYNIRIKQVSADGVDMVGLLQKQDVAARSVLLLKPVIQIINTGADNPRPITTNDTLELYRKILGKFRSIRAGEIAVDSGTVLFTNRAGQTQTALENINITLNNFLVDSTKDYQNIISYFIKDVKVTVENIQLPVAKNDSKINVEKVDYDAAKKYIRFKSIRQYRSGSTKAITELNNIQVSGLNTDAFILQQQLRAGQISCDGGLVTIYTHKKDPGAKKAGGQSLELSTGLIDEARIGGIVLGNTRVVIVNRDEPEAAPFVLNNANFKVTKVLNIDEGTSINNIINNAEWELSADGFSFGTKKNNYKFQMGRFLVNSAASLIKIKNFTITPVLTEAEDLKQNHYQHDRYNMSFDDIELSGVNVKKLVADKAVEVEKVTFRNSLRIFNDRMLPSEDKIKEGNYPHQQVLKLPFPLYVHTVRISNSLVSYRERAEKSTKIGDVFFNGVNATLTNITNIPERIKANPRFTMSATAKLLGEGKLSSEWEFPLNTSNGAFKITGRLASMKATTLNTIIEPLAMASVKQGQIDEVAFTINGTETKALGDILFLYHDLKMDLLKKGNDTTLKRRGLLSFVANAVIKNQNTNRNNNEKVEYDRDRTKSFFNLIWKTIFTGAKNSEVDGIAGQK